MNITKARYIILLTFSVMFKMVPDLKQNAKIRFNILIFNK